MADHLAANVILILLCFGQISNVLTQAQDAGTTNDEDGDVESQVKFTEIDVWGLRLWQVAGIFLAGITAIVMLACWVCDIRIPRTKEEIEARYKKKLVVEKYADEMNTIFIKDLPRPPPEAAEVQEEVQLITPKRKERATPKQQKPRSKSTPNKLLKKLTTFGRSEEKDTQIEESMGPIIHNPVSSDPALTANPKVIEEPLGGHMTKPGQSSRQYTLSNL